MDYLISLGIIGWFISFIVMTMLSSFLTDMIMLLIHMLFLRNVDFNTLSDKKRKLYDGFHDVLRTSLWIAAMAWTVIMIFSSCSHR